MNTRMRTLGLGLVLALAGGAGARGTFA
ncbi:MAG: hypothetical protein K0Q72_4014, partial [Armatimonadetes bacterium]|nr:hypothetical protein [Armatimonadota bacterium]